MLTENAVHKRFTACGDAEAERLLQNVLGEMKIALADSGVSVYLGGSYGRGDGGVRKDRENGILYNDLDFFVFARKKCCGVEVLLKDIAEKYEKTLHVDVDFSSIMSINDVRNNAKRLMMQELKRGYHLVSGEDLLAEYLPEFPAEKLPFSEACRLLLNRGMGLRLAAEKICGNSPETDFILRNLYKAVLGAGDAMLISDGKYRWKIAERLELIENSDLSEMEKALYREAVCFKQTPHRQKEGDMSAFWLRVRDFYCGCMLHCADGDLANGFYRKSARQGEFSLLNFMKYCIKTRSFPFWNRKKYSVPAVAAVLPELFDSLDPMPERIDRKSKLYRHWLIFN